MAIVVILIFISRRNNLMSLLVQICNRHLLTFAYYFRVIQLYALQILVLKGYIH